MTRTAPFPALIFCGLSLSLGFLTACAARPDCDPISGFELGRSSKASDSRCDERPYAQAWRLGQTLGDLESEFKALEQIASPTVAEQQRLRVLQREIPELETLARLDGLLPAEAFDGQRP